MVKRGFALLLTLCCLCGCAAAEDAAAFVRAPLYDAPSEQAEELMCYHIGTRVEVIRDVDARYVQVNVGREGGSLMGYMEKRDLEFGEESIRSFRAEWVTYRGMETQTCRLYSYPDKNAPVIDEAFDLTLQKVLGFKDRDWLHVVVFEGGTGFVALDELEGETVHYEAAPYIDVEPTAEELSREEALAEAKVQIAQNQPDLNMARLERCAVEMDVIYYYEFPGQLTYTIDFRDPETGYIYTGVSFLVKGKEIVKVSFGNG